jgi:hypothetical protein
MTRNRFLTLVLVSGFAAGAAAGAAEETLPKAETVLDRFVEVTGGKNNYEKHRSEVATMSMEFIGKGIKGSGVHYADSSNNSYESMALEGIGKVDSGVLNGIAWESNPITGPRLREGAEKADSLRDSRFNAPLYWRELYKSAETAGIEDVNGESCYKVILTPASGKPSTNFYSKKTGLLVKISRVVTSQMGEVPVELFVQDYKTYDGIVMPAKISQKMMGSEIVVSTNDVKFNTEIAKDRFEPPPDVKKLMAK